MNNIEIKKIENVIEKIDRKIMKLLKSLEEEKIIYRKKDIINKIVTLLSLLLTVILAFVPQLVVPFIFCALLTETMSFVTIITKYKSDKEIEKLSKNYEFSINLQESFRNNLLDELEIRKILKEKEDTNIITENEIQNMNEIINNNERIIHSFSKEELKELSSYIENDKIYSKLDQIYMIEKYGEKQKILENIKKSLENLNSIDLLEDTLSYIKTKEKVKKIDELVNKK